VGRGEFGGDQQATAALRELAGIDLASKRMRRNCLAAK